MTALRVFLGPTEYAGVVWGYREALRSTGVKALAVTFHHPFGYPADISLRGGRYRRNLQLTLLLPWALRTFHLVVRRLLAACHIVVDQLLVGWFGGLALEAMALGRPVICYLDDRWTRLIPETADLPIVRATPETLKETLGSLVQDPVRCQALGLAGRAYIERVHHPVRMGQALLAIYTGAAQPCEPWRAPVRSEIGSETGAGP